LSQNLRWRTGTLAALLGLSIGAAAIAEPALVAAEITAERFAELTVGGPDADAGLGDWALQNGTLCAAVSAPEHESPLSPEGGVLIDLGHCRAQDDQWSTLQPLVNLDRGGSIPMQSIEGEVVDGVARVVTRGARPGVRIESRFLLDLAEPDVLRVETELTRTSTEGYLFAFADVALHATGQLRAFGLLRRDLDRSPGFVHPAGNPFSLLSMLDAIVSADAYVLVGGDALEPIAYGVALESARIRYANGDEAELPSFANSGESHTMLGVFGGPLWFGSADPPGVFAFAQLPLMSLSEGDVLLLERSIHVSRRNDVASVSDVFFPDGAVVQGQLAEDARIHVFNAAGAPITEARSGSHGRFAFRLPLGDYRLEFRAPAGTSERTLTLGKEGKDLGRVETPASVPVLLPSETSMQLIFLGIDGTETPSFGDDLLGLTIGEHAIPAGIQTNTVSLAGIASDPETVELPPGRYRVLASRGLEYTVTQTALDVVAGGTMTLEIAPPLRAFETPGFIAADLHLHSAESFDSSFPLRDQVRAFAALGGEVYVGTEHDRVFDPRPTIESLGLAERMASIVGVEGTSAYPGADSPFTVGHFNALPVPYEPTHFRGGAPAAEGRRLRDVIDDLRALPSATLIQLNHPRDQYDAGVEEGSYFTHLATAGEAYDPTASLEDAPNRVLAERAKSGTRDLDYDAVELLNGGSMDRYRITRADWFSLLLQGIVHTGTANSDTHRAGRLPAIPRNDVPMTDDDPARFNQAEFMQAIREGRSYGTSGPMLRISLGGGQSGDTFQGADAELSVEILAAPWVPVEELRIFVNGALVEQREAEAGGRYTIPLHFEDDAFVTVEVEGTPDETYDTVAPGFTPFAFSNPFFVDANADGQWTPPGLSGEPPITLTDPIASP
jgi:hypothetical protein